MTNNTVAPSFASGVQQKSRDDQVALPFQRRSFILKLPVVGFVILVTLLLMLFMGLRLNHSLNHWHMADGMMATALVGAPFVACGGVWHMIRGIPYRGQSLLYYSMISILLISFMLSGAWLPGTTHYQLTENPYFGAFCMVLLLGTLSIAGWGYVGWLADRIPSQEVSAVASVLCALMLSPVAVGLPVWFNTFSEESFFQLKFFVPAALTTCGVSIFAWMYMHINMFRPRGDELLSKVIFWGYSVALVTLFAVLYYAPESWHIKGVVIVLVLTSLPFLIFGVQFAHSSLTTSGKFIIVIFGLLISCSVLLPIHNSDDILSVNKTQLTSSLYKKSNVSAIVSFTTSELFMDIHQHHVVLLLFHGCLVFLFGWFTLGAMRRMLSPAGYAITVASCCALFFIPVGLVAPIVVFAATCTEKLTPLAALDNLTTMNTTTIDLVNAINTSDSAISSETATWLLIIVALLPSLLLVKLMVSATTSLMRILKQSRDISVVLERCAALMPASSFQPAGELVSMLCLMFGTTVLSLCFFGVRVYDAPLVTINDGHKTTTTVMTDCFVWGGWGGWGGWIHGLESKREWWLVMLVVCNLVSYFGGLSGLRKIIPPTCGLSVLFIPVFCLIVALYVVHPSWALKTIESAVFCFSGSVLFWSFVWTVKGTFRSMVDPQGLAIATMASCCVLMFLPFGVLLPALLATSFDEKISIINSDNSSSIGNDTTTHLGVQGTVLKTSIFVVAFMLVLFVSIWTVALNATMHKTRVERAAKAAVARLRMALKPERVRLDPEIGRLIWKEYCEKSEQQLQDLLLRRSLVDWIEDVKKNELELCLREFVEGEMEAGRICMHPHCVEGGWNVPVSHDGNEQMLCGACMDRTEAERGLRAKELVFRIGMRKIMSNLMLTPQAIQRRDLSIREEAGTILDLIATCEYNRKLEKETASAALAAFDAEHFKEAETLYNQALEFAEMVSEGVSQLVGMGASVPHHLSRTTASTRSHASYHINLCTTYHRLGLAEQALAHVNQCLCLRPSWPRVYIMKGATLSSLGRIKSAITVYETALKVCGGASAGSAGARAELLTLLADAKLDQDALEGGLSEAEQMTKRIREYEILERRTAEVELSTALVNLYVGWCETLRSCFSRQDDLKQESKAEDIARTLDQRLTLARQKCAQVKKDVAKDRWQMAKNKVVLYNRVELRRLERAKAEAQRRWRKLKVPLVMAGTMEAERLSKVRDEHEARVEQELLNSSRKVQEARGAKQRSRNAKTVFSVVASGTAPIQNPEPQTQASQDSPRQLDWSQIFNFYAYGGSVQRGPGVAWGKQLRRFEQVQAVQLADHFEKAHQGFVRIEAQPEVDTKTWNVVKQSISSSQFEQFVVDTLLWGDESVARKRAGVSYAHHTKQHRTIADWQVMGLEAFCSAARQIARLRFKKLGEAAAMYRLIQQHILEFILPVVTLAHDPASTILQEEHHRSEGKVAFVLPKTSVLVRLKQSREVAKDMKQIVGNKSHARRMKLMGALGGTNPDGTPVLGTSVLADRSASQNDDVNDPDSKGRESNEASDMTEDHPTTTKDLVGSDSLTRFALVTEQASLHQKVDEAAAMLKEEKAEIERLRAGGAAVLNKVASMLSFEPDVDDYGSTDDESDEEQFTDNVDNTQKNSELLQLENISTTRKGGRENKQDQRDLSRPVQTFQTWSNVVHVIMLNLPPQQDPNSSLSCSDDMDIPINWGRPSNLFALLLLLLEWFSLVCMVLTQSLLQKQDPDTGLNSDSEKVLRLFSSLIMFKLNSADVPQSWNIQISLSFEIFPYFFWISAAIALMFPFYARNGVKQAKAGKFGLDDHGFKANLCTYKGVYSKMVGFLGGSLYLQILKTLMSAFSCIFASPFHLSAQPSVECFKPSTHYIYMVVGGLGLICYYPVATLVVPNLQFQDKTLEIKFNPSFIVWVQQGIFLMTTCMVFLSESNADFCLVFYFCVFLGLGFACLRFRPCNVARMNRWKALNFFMPAAVCIAGLVDIFAHSQPSSAPYLVLGISWTLLMSWVVYGDQKEYGVFRSQHRQTPVVILRSAARKMSDNSSTLKFPAPTRIKQLQPKQGGNLVLYDVEDDTMVACPGTVQGDSGWYAEPCADGRVVAIYWEVDQTTGEWRQRNNQHAKTPVVTGPSSVSLVNAQDKESDLRRAVSLTM